MAIVFVCGGEVRETVNVTNRLKQGSPTTPSLYWKCSNMLYEAWGEASKYIHDRWKSFIPSWCDFYDRLGSAAIYGRSFRSNLSWTGHFMRISPNRLPKSDNLLSTAFGWQKERTRLSSVEGFHQEKPDAEGHQDRLMNLTHIAAWWWWWSRVIPYLPWNFDDPTTITFFCLVANMQI